MNVVITGASKGIGFELAKCFANDENNVVVAIARSEKHLKELKNECLKQNLKHQLKTLVFDLENPEYVKTELHKHLAEHLTSVDVLINNAGYLINKPFTDIPLSDIHKSLNINFISHAILIQELIPLLKKSKISHVVNISSMGGFQGSSKFPGLSFYSASKAALANLTECLAEEFKNDEIRFNCLALGAVNTEMLRNAFPGFQASVNPHEMARYIYDFAINGYKFFNGKILPVSNSTP